MGKPNKKYTYEVYDIATQKKYLFSSISGITKLTGFSVGYIGNKLSGRDKNIKDYDFSGEYKITKRDRLPTDVYNNLKTPHKKRVLYRQKIDYDVLIHEEDGVLYYLDAYKKIKKSRRVFKHRGDSVLALPVTEADYAKFDIEALYNEKFVKWREKGIYRDDITLIKEFIDIIIYPEKHRSPTTKYGNGRTYNVTSLLDKPKTSK